MHEIWRALFGNNHPVEVEIGPGTGLFLISRAQLRPDTSFFGIECSRTRAARLCSALERRGILNARAVGADAACVIGNMIPAASVSAYHIYFPDPWWKRRHHQRRLFTPEFTRALERTLVPGGRIYTATDVAEVAALIRRMFGGSASLRIDDRAVSCRVAPTTFERKGLQRGATIHEAVFAKHPAELHTSSAAPMTPAESPS
jgi:tRNA (guanine-N7-)-methyltransferase